MKKKNLALSLILSFACLCMSQEVLAGDLIPSQNLSGVVFSAVAWGDYDGDGKLDLVVTGFSGSTFVPVTKLYKNTSADTLAEDVTQSLTGVQYSSVAWGDYDNDGDLDLVISGLDATGTPITKIYKNDPTGTLTEDVTQSLTGVVYSSLAWGDYDNDGDLDLVIVGSDSFNPADPNDIDPIAKVYRNDPVGTLTEDIGQSLIGVALGAVAWGDYDGDGDLDLAITGRDPSSAPITKLYRNDPVGTLTEDVNQILMNLEYSSAGWGDYDNDGDIDLVMTGSDAAVTPFTKIYRNDLGTLVEDATQNLANVRSASIAWGDYDNDGNIDLIIAGADITMTPVVKLYKNDPVGTLTEDVTQSLMELFFGAVAWGDYDNDGDLDLVITGIDATFSAILSILYSNVPADFDISGNIGYFSDDAPIPNAAVDITGDDTYSTTTNTGGDYLFNDIPGGIYVSTPSKADDLGGLSGMDASRIARYAAGLYSLNCLEMIAGDVSMNSEISGMDASRVARYAVGSITELNDDGIEWVFTPEPIPECDDWPPIVYENTREYSPLESDLTDEDFIGIRLGDVSGNWSPDTRMLFTQESSEATKIEANINSTLRIPIVIEEATAIEGIDISIAFNKEVLHLSGLTLNNGILAENDYAVESNLKEGKIVIYAQKELVSGAGVFAFMDFDVIGDVGSSSEIYLTRFDVNETEASGGFNVVDSENETVTRRLQIDVGQTLLEKFALYPNNPNPFSTRTLIQYDLPKDTHIIIQVYNVKGQLVEELVNGFETAGRKQIEWNAKDSSSGIYFYRLSTEDKTIIKKMVLMR